MRSQLFCAVLVSAMAALTQAFPTGSPICNSNATSIQNAKQMGTLQNNLGFQLDLSAFPGGKYTPGKQYMINLKGTQQFSGILMYAVNADKTSHPGTFAITNGYKAVTPQNGPPCPGAPDGTITQTDATPKGPNVSFMWTAPNNNSGPLTFLGVAVTKGNGFQLLKSNNAVTPSGGASTGNTTTNTGNTTTNGNNGGDPTTGGYGGNGANGGGNNSTGTGTDTNNPSNSPATAGTGTSGAGVLVANNALLLAQFFIGFIGAYLFSQNISL